MNRVNKVSGSFMSTDFGEILYNDFENENPKIRNGRGVVVAPGAFPVKVTYDWIGYYLASNGYRVIVTAPKDLDTKTMLYFPVGNAYQNSLTAGLIAGIDHLEQAGIPGVFTALIGHSLGANSAWLVPYFRDIGAVVGLAPGWSDPEDGQHDESDRIISLASMDLMAPSMIITGTRDGFVGYEASEIHYSQIPAVPNILLPIIGGSHTGFMDPGVLYAVAKMLGIFKLDIATISHQDQLKETRIQMLTFLNNVLF